MSLNVYRKCVEKASGFATLVVLVIIAVTTIFVTTLFVKNSNLFLYTANMIHNSRAAQYNEGARLWAQQIITEDHKSNSFDHPGEDWAYLDTILPIEGGQIAGKLFTLDGGMNLNNLIDENGERNDSWYELFAALFRQLDIPLSSLDSLVDWLDKDLSTLEGVLEDTYYLSRGGAYRTPNTKIAHLSELKLVSGFTSETIRRLADHVTVIGDQNTININFATELVTEVLASCWKDRKLDLDNFQNRKPFDSLASFISTLARVNRANDNKLCDVITDKTADNYLSVESTNFQLHTTVGIDNREFSYVSKLTRQDDQVILGSITLTLHD